MFQAEATITVKTDKKQYNVSTIGHCFFCLRKVTSAEVAIYVDNNIPEWTDMLQNVPGTNRHSLSCTTLLSTLNKCWAYLQKGGQWNWNDRNAGKRPVEFASLPIMCQYCAHHLDTISDLMSKFIGEINKLGSIMCNSKPGGMYSWRGDMFERALKDTSLVEYQSVIDTLQFLGMPYLALLEQPFASPFIGLNEQPETVQVPDAGIKNDDISNDNPDYIKEDYSSSQSECSDSFPEACATLVGDDPLGNDSDVNKRRKTFSCYARELDTYETRQHDNVVDPSKPTCAICYKQLSDERSLRRHIARVHENVRNVTRSCDLCSAKVPRQQIYEHVRDHVGEEYMTTCPNFKYCFSAYCSEKNLTSHLRTCAPCRKVIPDVEKYIHPSHVCEVCGEKSTNRFGLQCHLSRQHEIGTKTYPCPIQGCPKRFCVRQSVVLHIPQHTNKVDMSEDKDQECDVCKEKVKPEEIEQHLKDTHNVQDALKCVHCPFLFSSRENLMDHLFEHRHMGLFCDICGDRGATFYKLDHLRKHYFTAHQIGRKFLCEHCDKEYYSNRGLDKHLANSHTAVPDKNDTNPSTSKVGNISSEKMLKCDECDGVEYKFKTSLIEHKIKYHGAEHLRCKFCEEKFPNFNSRSRHEMEHRGAVGKVKYPCQVVGCGKVYSTKKMLNQHISYEHDGVKSNVCEQCGKTYPSKNTLKKHIEAVHMGLRNEVCDICGESFTCRQILRRHKMIHTGERPFACELCDQRFRQKVVLWRHLEGHKKKGSNFKPNGPMKQIRKRVETKTS